MIIREEIRKELFNKLINMKNDLQMLASIFQNEINITKKDVQEWQINKEKLIEEINVIEDKLMWRYLFVQ